MEVYLKLHRLLYDPDRGIPIETMHPEKADWETLNLNGPPPLGVKAIDAKRQFQREQEDRLTRSVEVAKPKPGRPLGGGNLLLHPHQQLNRLGQDQRLQLQHRLPQLKEDVQLRQ